MRLAAAGVSIAPIALPSPACSLEHELTDPFRNARTTIPGSYPSEVSLGTFHNSKAGDLPQCFIKPSD